MIRLGKQAKQRRIAAGVVVGLVGVLGAVLALWPRDPNPPARFSVHVRRDQGRGFSPDGRSYLVGDAQETTAWDLNTGHATTRKSPRSWGKSPVALKAFSRDRRHFAGWSVAEQAVLWGDAATGEVRGKFPVKLPQDTILPRSAWIADDRKIELVTKTANPVGPRRVMEVFTWDVASGIETRRTVHGPAEPHGPPIAYGPDGRTWVYFDPAQDAIRFWDAEADQSIGDAPRPPTTHRNPAVPSWSASTFMPDGRTFIFGLSNGQIEFWDMATRRPLKTVQVLPGRYYVQNLQVSPDGRTLVTSGEISRSTAWVARAWDQSRRWLTGKSPSEFAGEFVITDLSTDRPLARYSRINFAEFSPDGRLFSTDDPRDTISIRDTPRPTGR